MCIGERKKKWKNKIYRSKFCLTNFISINQSIMMTLIIVSVCVCVLLVCTWLNWIDWFYRYHTITTMVKIIIKTNRFLLNLWYIIQFNNIYTLYMCVCVCNKTKIIITKQTPVCSKFKLSITVHCMVFSDFQKNFSSNSKKKNIKWLMFDCKINGKNGQREKKKRKSGNKTNILQATNCVWYE